MIERLFSSAATSHPFRRMDILAGLSVAGILLPEAVAYAAIAHLNIQAAICALLAGLLCYAILGESRFAIVSPTSSSSALVAAAAFSLLPANSAEQAALSFALVILTGGGLIVLAFARLGRLSAFISRPVLHGFSFALALTIIIKQFPIILGIHASGANPFMLLAAIGVQFAIWSWWSLGAGAFALLLLLVIKHYSRLPGAFIVLTLGIGLAFGLDLSSYHISTVGTFELNWPHPGLPHLPLQKWLDAAEIAGGLLVIIFAESWGSIRSLAITHGDHVEPNRELFALGSANLLSGLIQGMPVGAGFSASSANESAGAKSRWAGVIAALCILLLVLTGKPLIEHIPEPILAAAVIGALLHALNPRPLLALWRMNRDQYLMLAALISVLSFGMLHGMLIAVALSIASAIRTFSQPSVRELTELNASRNYVDHENHPEARLHPHILILRPEEPLFFASIDGILDVVKSKIGQRSDCLILILSLEQSSDLDSSATESLMELSSYLEKHQVITLFARVKDPVRQLLSDQGYDNNHLFWSVADAAEHAKQHLKETSP